MYKVKHKIFDIYVLFKAGYMCYNIKNALARLRLRKYKKRAAKI